jgi:hypothetical protein
MSAVKSTIFITNFLPINITIHIILLYKFTSKFNYLVIDIVSKYWVKLRIKLLTINRI